MSDEQEEPESEFSRRFAELTPSEVDAILAKQESERRPAPDMPIFRWEEMHDYVPGTWVLARSADRQIYGFERDGQWYEIVDGDEQALKEFTPIEWCDPPGDPAAWT